MIEFPPGLSAPALRALHGAGYRELGQLASVDERSLLALHGMGPKAMGLLREAMARNGLTFRSG